MANKSTHTRKELVLRYLQQHRDQWVDGPELANERVGGSEGLKRVRELRADNYRIKTRPHPDRTRDIFQYMLVTNEGVAPVVQHRLDEIMAAQERPVPPFVDAVCPRCGATSYVPLPATCVLNHEPTQMVAATEAPPIPPMVTPGMAGREFPMRLNDQGMFELTKEVCVECGGMYDDDLEHRTTDTRHLRWMEGQQQLTGGQQTIGVPEQPPPYKFTKMPERIEMGKVLPCPRCGGKRRLGRTYFSRKKGEVVTTQAEDFTRDPFKPMNKGEPNPCIRCGGFGVIPQHVMEGDDAVQHVRE